MRPINVFEVSPGNFRIDAPIGTYSEKLEADYADRERIRLREEARVAAEAEDTQARKRLRNLKRLHKRLMRRCFDKVTPSLKLIWETFDIAQQYAILKDIDYEIRHKGV